MYNEEELLGWGDYWDLSGSEVEQQEQETDPTVIVVETATEVPVPVYYPQRIPVFVEIPVVVRHEYSYPRRSWRERHTDELSTVREKTGEGKKGHSSTLVLALSGIFLVLLTSSMLSSTLKGSTSRTSTRSSAVSNQVYTIDDPSYRVTGSPTISADFINKVLAAYGSPAAGTGNDLYDLGIQFGIDPVYALAFFLHEDSFGKAGWGAVNRSLGNIRCSTGYSCQGGYRSYASWANAYKDWYSLISDGYVHGSVAGHPCTTVDEIIPVYAPAADHNNEAAYKRAIKHAVDTWRSGRVWV